MDIKSGVSTAIPHYLKDGTSQFLEKKYSTNSEKLREEKLLSVSAKNESEPSKKNKDSKLAISQEYYKYPHDYENGYVAQQYLPDELGERAYYEPKSIGFEKEIKMRIEKLRGSDE